MSWRGEIMSRKCLHGESCQSGEDRPLAVSARYDRQLRRIVIRLNTGSDISFLPGDQQCLEGATGSELDVIEIFPSGMGIHFPKLDADLYLPPLLQRLIGWEPDITRWAAPRHNGYRGGPTSSRGY